MTPVGPVRAHAAPDPRAAVAWAVVFVAAWTTVEVIASPLLASMPIPQLVWSRYAVHLVIVVLVWGVVARQPLVRTGRPALQAFRSTLMLVMPMSWALAMHAGHPASITMAVFWSTPLLIVAFAALLGQEPPRRSTVATAALAAAAAALASGAVRLPAGSEWPMPLAMAASFSLYIVLTRMLRNEPIGVNLFWTGAGVFLLLTPAMPFFWSPVSIADSVRLVGIGALGVVALYALDRMAAAGEVGPTAPVIATQAAVLVGLSALAGHVSATELGGALVVVACFVASAGFVGRRRAEAGRRVGRDASEAAHAGSTE